MGLLQNLLLAEFAAAAARGRCIGWQGTVPQSVAKCMGSAMFAFLTEMKSCLSGRWTAHAMLKQGIRRAVNIQIHIQDRPAVIVSLTLKLKAYAKRVRTPVDRHCTAKMSPL
jgi:hypothetical protein